MNPTITAAIANQRHAELIAEAAAHRRASTARRADAGSFRSTAKSPTARRVSRPIGAFYSWLAAGQL